MEQQETNVSSQTWPLTAPKLLQLLLHLEDPEENRASTIEVEVEATCSHHQGINNRNFSIRTNPPHSLASMPTFRNEGHMKQKFKATYSHSHHYPEPATPVRPRSQKLASLITKFESLDLRGKDFSQLEMQPVPLQLPRRKEHITREKERLVSGNRDMDAEMEVEMRGVDGGELETFARHLEEADMRGAGEAEWPVKQFSMETMPVGLGQLCDGQQMGTRRKSFVTNTSNQYRTPQKKEMENQERLPFPADPFSAHPVLAESSMVCERAGDIKRVGGGRRESKILDRIRMFDGPMDFPKAKAPTSLIKGTPNSSSPEHKQRVMSAERKPVLYTPSSVRNSYVGRSGTKTPTRTVGHLMWTPASKDSRTRKKELYAHTRSRSHGRTREEAQSSTVTANTPLKVHPPPVDQIQSQHQLIQAWADQSPSSYRQQNLKTPTPQPTIKGPDGYFALEGEKTPGNLNRSIRNERVRRMAKSRMDIREKLGKVIEARVGSFRSVDPGFMTSLREGAGRDEDDRASLLENDSLIPPISSETSAEREEDTPRSFLEKEMLVPPLRVEARKVKPIAQCCADGTPPSRKVSQNAPQERWADDGKSSGSESDFPETRRASKLADRISMFEKVFRDSVQRRQTLPVLTATTSTEHLLQSQTSPSQVEYSPRSKTPKPAENFTDGLSNSLPDRYYKSDSPRLPYTSPSRNKHKEDLKGPPIREREIVMEFTRDLSPTASQAIVSPEVVLHPLLDFETPEIPETDAVYRRSPKFNSRRVPTVSRPTMSRILEPQKVQNAESQESPESPESPELDTIFKSPQKFNTRRVTMPHTVAPRPPTSPPKPKPIKPGTGIFERINIWEKFSAASAAESPASNSGHVISPPAVSKGKRQFSGSKSWMKPGDGSGKKKGMDGKEVADLVNEVGKEMGVAVISGDVARTREEWKEKERMEREKEKSKPLMKVFSTFHAVPGVSRRTFRRSTTAVDDRSERRSGLTANHTVPREQDPVGFVARRKPRGPDVMMDLGSAGDGSLSTHSASILTLQPLLNPLRRVSPYTADTSPILEPSIEQDQEISNTSSSEDAEHLEVQPRKINKGKDVAHQFQNKREDDSRASASFGNSSGFTEKFMKGLRDGKPKSEAGNTTENLALKKTSKHTEIESRLPMGRLRYPKMYNLQKGNFKAGSGANSDEEAVFAYSPNDSSVSSRKGKSNETETDIERRNNHVHRCKKERSMWEITDGSDDSTTSAISGSEANQGGYMKLGVDSGDGDGDAWLGARSSRSRSEISAGTHVAMTLQSPERIQIDDSSSSSSPGPSSALLARSDSDSVLDETIMPLPLRKLNSEKHQKSKPSSVYSASGFGNEDVDSDEEDFDIVDEMEGPLLLGKRVKSGQLYEPKPLSALEQERLLLLCRRSSNWGSEKDAGGGGGMGSTST